MKKIAIFAHKVSPENIQYLNLICETATQKGFSIYFEINTLAFCQNIEGFCNIATNTFSHHADLPSDTDLFFAFGGDGTMLRAQTFIQEYAIPIVGINLGRLGFLAFFTIEEINNQLVSNLLDNNFLIDERSMLSVRYLGDNPTPENHFALNELAITRKETTSMIMIEAFLNDEPLNNYWADGLIIATPTGSTGYSLSCGGPIIDPRNHNLVITPIAPHNLFVRPFIISDDDVIKLRIDSRADEYLLTLDSRISSLSKNIELEVKKASYTAKIVRLEHHSYINALREKLYWGLDQRNGK